MSSAILELAVKSSAVIALAAVTAGVMQRRASAASRHLLWTLTVVGLLALPIASAMLPSWNISVPRQLAATPAAHQPAEIASGSTMAAESSAFAGPVEKASFKSVPSVVFLPLVYATVVLFLLGRLGLEHLSIRRMLSRTTPVADADWTRLLTECEARLGVRKTVRLARSREDVMPMACGTRRPVIVIPSVADLWDDDRRRAVILHELAHVVRLDCLTQTLAEAAVSLYWPHPGVWWTARRLRLERELACDDCVLSSGTEPREYAGHLLEIAYSLGGHRAPALAVGMARLAQLEARMGAMLDATRNRRTPPAGGRLLALALAVGVVAPLAAATIVSVPGTPAVPTALASRGESTAAAVGTLAAQDLSATPLAGGTWQIRLAADGRSAHLTIGLAENAFHSTTMPLDRIEGLAAMLTGPGGPAHYVLKRDAGAFDFDGVIRAGAGGGTFSFTPSATFGNELVRRGFSKPTPFALGTLAWSDIGFAFIDELNVLQYERPTLQQLVNGAQHGVTRSYVGEMADLGYRVGTIDALVRLRDHGVEAGFVRSMQAEGFSGLRIDDLVRMRDHGIDPAFIRDLRAIGYRLDLEQLVDARNHGIDSGYVGSLRALGYGSLTLDRLIDARNHGIDPDYIRALRQLGYQLTLDELIDARNHGVDSAYINEMASAGYPRLPLADLIQLRNHGVDAKTVQQLKGGGIDRPSLDQLIELPNRGASADIVGPRLHASKGFMANLHAVLRDAGAAWQRWSDRWLKAERRP